MDDWYMDTAGQFALRMQKMLLLHCLAPWPRRCRELLEINCGSGIFLPLFQECGFDVTATDPRLEMRRRAAPLTARIELLAAAEDHLPFEDAAFDWAVLHLSANDLQAAQQAIREGFRVASSGLVVTFWNTAAPSFIFHQLCNRTMAWPGGALCWWQVWRELKNLDSGHISGASVLAGPRATWNASRAVSRCNRVVPWLPLGAWSALRLDMAPTRPVTPLRLKIEHKRLRRPEPALEYGHKTQARAGKTRSDAL